MIPNRPRYAARLNAFKLGLKNPTVPDLLARIAEVPGIDAADLNFPDHFEGIPPATLSRIMADHGIALNGVAMRYYTDPGFRLGAFSNPDAKVRQAAVDITKRGLDGWQGDDPMDGSRRRGLRLSGQLRADVGRQFGMSGTGLRS